MNYQETLDWLYSQLPMFTRDGASAYKKDLTNTIALLDFLDNPQRNFKSIHIAGTNGKGSSSHMLASICAEAGLKTGLYTSPHLKDFRERIKVNGVMCDQQFVIDFIDKIKHRASQIKPSFFEMTVAMAFEYFKLEKVDIAIIETGLGGRLDSTNIINPEVSLITNIGWDHMDMLGDTLAKIAFEKAGIIKPGIPVLIGEKHPETSPVFTNKANQVSAPIYFAEDLIPIKKFSTDGLKSKLTTELNGPLSEVECELAGFYQEKNIRSVIACAKIYQKINPKISDLAIANGIKKVIKNTGLLGRWQILNQSPLVICDTGHNKEGIEFIVKQIEKTPHKKLHFVLGMVKDKDQDKILSLLPTYAHYYFCQAKLPRALNANELSEKANKFGLKGLVIPDIPEAYQKALDNSGVDDLIFIGGSTFVVAEVL